MAEEDAILEQEMQKKLASDLFNLTWDLLDKKERTQAENDTMVHAAHASRFHWGEIGTPLHFARGEWQISRVYAVLGRSEPALYHARRSVELCTENGIGDFDLAFAYEALARAYAVAGDASNSQKYVALGEQASQQIEDQGNRDYFLSELKSVGALL